MLDFLMQKFCWQFSSLSVTGISSVSLLKFMSTWYHIVLCRFQSYVEGYCPTWLSEQLHEVTEADTFLSFLCTWNLRNKWVETQCLNKIFPQFSISLFVNSLINPSCKLYSQWLLGDTVIRFKTKYNKLISVVCYCSLPLMSGSQRSEELLLTYVKGQCFQEHCRYYFPGSKFLLNSFGGHWSLKYLLYKFFMAL